MAEYCLTAEEVLYLAAIAGADAFYGVPDTLSGLSDQELRLKVVEIENGLGEKGYLEEDFDGNRSVLPELAEVIEHCGNCERFLCFETERVGEPKKACMYFVSDGTSYKMSCEKEQYTFSVTGIPTVRKEVEAELALKKTDKKEEGSCEVSYEKLEKAATLARRGSAEQGRELLKKEGVSDVMAQNIMNGILNKVNFHSLLFMDFRDENNPGYSVQYLSGNASTVMEYGADYETNRDYLRFLTADDTELKERLEKGFRKIGCEGEDEIFS